MLRISRLQTNQFGQLIFSAEPTRNRAAAATTGDLLATRAARPAHARSAASCPTSASSTSTPRRCRATSRTSGREAEPDADLRPALRLRHARLRRERDVPERPRLPHGRVAARRSSSRRCARGREPAALPAARPLEQIPFNQYIQDDGRDELGPAADQGQLRPAPRRRLADQHRDGAARPATLSCGTRWSRAASTASTSSRPGAGRRSPASTPASSTRSAAPSRRSRATPAWASALRARSPGTAPASSTRPIARTPTRTSGTSSCSGRSRAT